MHLTIVDCAPFPNLVHILSVPLLLVDTITIGTVYFGNEIAYSVSPFSKLFAKFTLLIFPLGLFGYAVLAVCGSPFGPPHLRSYLGVVSGQSLLPELCAFLGLFRYS